MSYSEGHYFTRSFDLAGFMLDDGATLPAHAWPGGYPIVYVAYDGEDICPACANDGTHRISGNGLTCPWGDDPATLLIGFDVFYEGEPRHCANCDAELESAYGEPT